MVAIAAVIAFAYYTGQRIARAECRADSAINATNTNTDIINTIGKINAETLNTNTGDIRRILRARYTIAE